MWLPRIRFFRRPAALPPGNDQPATISLAFSQVLNTGSKRWKMNSNRFMNILPNIGWEVRRGTKNPQLAYVHKGTGKRNCHQFDRIMGVKTNFQVITVCLTMGNILPSQNCMFFLTCLPFWYNCIRTCSVRAAPVNARVQSEQQKWRFPRGH